MWIFVGLWRGRFGGTGREGGVVGYLYLDWEGSVVGICIFSGGVRGGSCGWCVGGVWAWIFIKSIFLNFSFAVWEKGRVESIQCGGNDRW